MMHSNENKFSIALIIASAGRFPYLICRIPIWSLAGFDQVIIVGKYKEQERKKLVQLCSKHNVTYIEEPNSFVDTRSKQRNTGAKCANTEWIFFGDDDDAIIAELDKSLLQKSAEGKDWLVGRTGEHIILHRREAFFEFGGYPEDMVSAEDSIMSNRTRRFGKGGAEGAIYRKVIPAPPAEPTSYFLTRAKNHFWYGLTFPILFIRTPLPKQVLMGEIRRLGVLFRQTIKGDKKNFIFISLRIMGYFLSMFHVLSIFFKSGLSGLKRETYASWQGLR